MSFENFALVIVSKNFAAIFEKNDFFHFVRKPFDYHSFLSGILTIFAVLVHFSTQFHKITKNKKLIYDTQPTHGF